MKNKRTASGPEVRSFKFQFEKRSDTESEIVIQGHAAVFDSPSDAGGLAPFMEVIKKGAFTTAITEDDVRALFNHDSNYVLGRNTAGTLEMKEDDTGLAVIIRAPKTQWAQDLAVSMERGDINQMSFSFMLRETKLEDGRTDKGESWEWKTEPPLRTITNVKLYDVSVVTYPWYEDTDAGVSGRAAEIFNLAKETRDMTPEELNAYYEEMEREIEFKEKAIKATSI